MKRLVIIAVLLLALPLSAPAADVTLKWSAVTGATGYKVDYTLDQGATWTGSKDAGALAPGDDGDVTYTYLGLPETGLVLLRVSAYNAKGEAKRVDAGAWYNHLWRLPTAPGGAGVR